MFAIHFGLLAALVGNGGAVATAAGNNPSTPLVCPDRWGEPGEPLVASERTARDIFIAIEREFFPGADKKNFPDVKARDEGAYWGVFRHRDSRRDRPKDGEIILHFAGHQLEMQIDKCTAAVSNVHYSR